ncbi:MAG TPA: hypothetical protein PLX08_02850 [Bacteroidales bacterium]|jgi:hypothetical protein|nr:hypothetical protein [Bacteroidales bacterium]
MDIDEFIELHNKSGYKIKTIHGNYFKAGILKCYSWPFNYRISLNDRLVKYLKWRYPISIICINAARKNTCEFVLKTEEYDINSFPAKKRNDIRQSLRNFRFARPDYNDILYAGFKINTQSLGRQNREDRILSNFKRWSSYIGLLYSHDDVILWGAYLAERMVGYLIVFKIDNRYSIHTAFIDRQLSGNASPMNGLIFSLVTQLIKEEGSVNISYGGYYFTPIPALNKYKKSMLFEASPASRAFIVNPILLFLFRFIVFFNIRVLKRRSIKNELTRKIIRIYQGNRLWNKERSAI